MEPLPALPPPVHEPPSVPYLVYVSNGRGYVWDADTALDLRVRYHIIGALVGSLPRNPAQNTFFGLPLLLLDEEVTLLLQKGLVRLVDTAKAHRLPTEEELTVVAASRAKELQDYNVARKEHAQTVSAIMREKRQKTENARTSSTAVVLEDATATEEKPNGSPVLPGLITTDRRQVLEEPPTPMTELASMMQHLVLQSPSTEATALFAQPQPFAAASEERSGTASHPSIPLHHNSLGDKPPPPLLPVSTPTSSSGFPWFDISRAQDFGTAQASGLWKFPSSDKARLKFKVFSALWAKGYYITSGSKFGGDFLLYPGDIMRYHAHFIVSVIEKTKSLTALDAIVMGRLGTAVKKSHAVCSWDDEKDELLCFCVRWTGWN
ncbi:hypothetical protein BC832DRAFT_618824 [Gaertneriomyces semiglobifer]|nr:hypothetical protein BC832DRAFT_618824 [Gaertneriomyces semiglobifer]